MDNPIATHIISNIATIINEGELIEASIITKAAGVVTERWLFIQNIPCQGCI